MEEEDRAVLEDEESVGTQGESLADGVGVIEAAQSSNKLGPEANQEERPTMLTQVTREEARERGWRRSHAHRERRTSCISSCSPLGT